ncbi:unnamed protein product [Discula destructiva]
MSATTTKTNPIKGSNCPTQVLSLGMARTGTASMAAAYRILGYTNVWHPLQATRHKPLWRALDRASDATFPSLPGHDPVKQPPFTRAEWDEIWGPCEAITDICSFFAPQLIAAYPEAHVVLVERDLERWYKSIDETVFKTLWGPWPEFLHETLGFGGCHIPAAKKMYLGFFEARNVDEMRAHARAAYKAHYRRVREMVPKDRLLEFKMEDGWGPLCEFLGKEIPEGVPFPRRNDAAELKAALRANVVRGFWILAGSVVPWIAVAVVVAVYLVGKPGVI